ncbi:MAG: hypothetical protein K6F70_04410 [Eggerthellaceae bacterium]|nr:hypothetical protein [Eggerthellaceae bacterium]
MKCHRAFRNCIFVIVFAFVSVFVVSSLLLNGCADSEGDDEEGQYDTVGGYYDHMCFDDGRIIDVDYENKLLLIEVLEGSHSTPSGTQVLLDYSGAVEGRFVKFDDRLAVGAVVSVGYFPIKLGSGGYSGSDLTIKDAD